MRSEEYIRLHEVCRDMAQQSGSEDLRDRWLRMAQVWLDRAADAETTKHSRTTSLSFGKHAAVSPGSFAVH
jgi:hypothetical protein